jgi:hypothetical protein
MPYIKGVAGADIFVSGKKVVSKGADTEYDTLSSQVLGEDGKFHKIDPTQARSILFKNGSNDFANGAARAEADIATRMQNVGIQK